MRCLHVITGLETAGAEMGLYKLVGSLDRAAVESAVLALADGGSLRPAVEALGVPVTSIGMRRGALPTASALRNLATAVRRFRPDVVHGWMYHGNLAAVAAAALAGNGPPTLWSVHSTLAVRGAEKRSTDLVIRVGARLSRRARAIVYVSRTAAEQHEAIGYAADRRVLIPYGFDTERFAPAPGARAALRATVGIPPDAPVIGQVARYHPQKDHENLLRAAAMLVARRPDVHFVLVGSGVDPRNAELTRRVAECGLVGRVHLLGERHDLAALTPGFDLATLSSAWGEAFPNVIGEAMACGVPVVATDVGDAAEIVADGGRVVPARDSGALASAWDGLLALGPDALGRLGRAARERVRAHYSLRAVAERYEDLYRDAAGVRGARRPPAAARDLQQA